MFEQPCFYQVALFSVLYLKIFISPYNGSNIHNYNTTQKLNYSPQSEDIYRISFPVTA